MVDFGASPSAVEKMWRLPGVLSPAAINPNPMHLSLAHLCLNFYRQQLHPGENFDVLQTIFLHKIDQSVVWEKISDQIVLSASARTKKVCLLGWCRTILLDAATRSFFDDRLPQINPEFFQNFFDFDDNSWQLTPILVQGDVRSQKRKCRYFVAIFSTAQRRKTRRRMACPKFRGRNG